MNQESLRQGPTLVRIALTVGLILFVTRQCRKPTWLLGRLILAGMNRGHRELTRWGIGRVAIANDAIILDVGCGGGQTINTLVGLATAGKVHGIDYSKASVAAARATNARWIDQGRVDVQLGSVSKLPFAENTFDVITAVETHYYWPDLARDVNEVLRVLKPGGRFVIIAEAYRGRRMDWLYRPAMRLLQATYLTPAEHNELLVNAGYSLVEVVEEPSKGWICATGEKRILPSC